MSYKSVFSVKFTRIKNLFDNTRLFLTMAFLYDFPEDEKGFKFIRQEEGGRNMRYTLEQTA